MKTKLIFIHGADPIESENKIIQKMIYFIYKNLFNFVPKYGFKKESWSKAFEKDGFDVININWNGKIIPYGVSDAINKTIEVLWRDLDCNYVFFTESIGTEIAFSAIEKCNYKNTKGFFAICPVNKPREINDFPIIFLNSKDDIFARFSNKILWPFKFFTKMKGKINILDINNIRHDQFVPSYKLETKNTLYSLVKEEIDKF